MSDVLHQSPIENQQSEMASTGFKTDVAISDVRRRAASSSRDETGESERERELILFSPFSPSPV
jgi:hypothetical protein